MYLVGVKCLDMAVCGIYIVTRAGTQNVYISKWTWICYYMNMSRFAGGGIYMYIVCVMLFYWFGCIYNNVRKMRGVCHTYMGYTIPI